MQSGKEKVNKAFEYAIDKIGVDNLSYPIWSDYVHYLRSVEVVGSYAENQKITTTRKVYQKGIATPFAGIENFWKEYVDFEKSINVHIAEKMTNERGKEYMNARRVAKEYESVTRGLNRNLPAVPPSASGEESKQLEIWKRYIAWEKSNPLKTEDTSLVIKRVVFAYEQALLCLGHHPDIWYEYASYLESEGSTVEKADASKQKYLDDAEAVYEKAINGLMKNNILIHFAYADFAEGRNKKQKSIEIYEKILATKDIDPTLIYIQYMRFTRRTDGIKQARVVFKRAREDTRSRHHAFTAAALLEFYSQKDRTVANKIFELGLKRFPLEVDFILPYAEFLRNGNDDNNTRVLFERVLTCGSLEPEKSIEVWNKFLEFEANIGDLASITKVEKRRTLAFDKTVSSKPRSETSWLIDRYRFNDLFPCSISELRSIGYDVTKSLTTSSAASVLLSQTLSNGVSSKKDGSGRGKSQSSSSNKPRPDINQMISYRPFGPHLPPRKYSRYCCLFEMRPMSLLFYSCPSRRYSNSWRSLSSTPCHL
jgi:cleavage stimulation factor subunit 3